MLCRLFTFLAAVSLVVCVATCVLWVVRGSRPDDHGSWPRVERTTGAGTRFTAYGEPVGWTVGRIVPLVPPEEPPDEPGGSPASRAWALAHQDVRTTWAGVRVFDGWGRRRPVREPGGRSKLGAITSRAYLVTCPYWIVAAATGPLPAAWGAAWVHRRWRARRRRFAGQCPACGYDLRATSARCPECGAEPKGATA